MSGESERVAAEKAAWRRRFRALREEMPGTTLATASAAIVARLQTLPEMETAERVHLFWPLPGEIDLRPLAEALRAQGRTVVLPVVAGPRTLTHRVFEGAADLVDGPWGLREPSADARQIDPASLDLVLVPGLAFGRDGSRLGYGGGFYDTFLAATSAARIGVGLHAALVDAVPALPHDARLDRVVTEAEAVRVDT